MTLPIRLRDRAADDIREARGWYDEQRAGLGDDFLDELRKTLDSIVLNPASYSRVRKDVRRALLRRFPFGVFYLVTSDEIVIIAVMHGSRSPKRWKHRR